VVFRLLNHDICDPSGQKKTARRRPPSSHGVVGLSGVERHRIAIVLPAIRHEADAHEAEDHERPG
jgi:hypothetical protein